MKTIKAFNTRVHLSESYGYDLMSNFFGYRQIIKQGEETQNTDSYIFEFRSISGMRKCIKSISKNISKVSTPKTFRHERLLRHVLCSEIYISVL